MTKKQFQIPTDFSAVRFRGTFRDYQDAVLKNAATHLQDKKIHIVAAPGSGKTVLGLELIRTLNLPTLVLSPSVTIRQQWGDRFEERFLPEGSDLEAYVSFDLKAPRAITSVTYQALHAASQHLVNEESNDISDENEDTDQDTPTTMPKDTIVEDFNDFDLVTRMKEQNIKVICLDEAHHLRSEWHKALVAFLKSMGDDLTIIALTATPPYDSTIAEWKRYESLCGPIDEEIFVPELVMKKTLCPHQDYIYFSYPTEKESEAIKRYRRNASACLKEIDKTRLLERALQATGLYDSFDSHLDVVLKNEAEFFTLFRMAERFNVALPSEVVKMTSQRNRYKAITPWKESWREFERALQFIIDSPDLFGPEISEELRVLMSRQGLLERRKVRLSANKKLANMILSSMGKLQGISQVVITESANMGDSLRMLILTDYIKREMMPLIGTNASFSTMGAVPIFETVRRAVGDGMRVALLSGSLVIVPRESCDSIASIAAEKGLPCSFKPIVNTDYSEAIFQGSNKNKVSVMTEAFQQGQMNILIGTKSLLGEGWDSPCINALILATFVGSFMLSNQMRGRAIRVDRNVPDKTANIWHLVTLDPVIGEDDDLYSKLMFSGLEKDRDLSGYDWDTLVRRFDCFMGPAYSRPSIESGVERIDILKPPFDRKGISAINIQMEGLSKARDRMARSWSDANPAGFYPVVETASEMPATRMPLSFTLVNYISLFLLALPAAALSILFYSASFGRYAGSIDLVGAIVVLVAIAVLLVLFGRTLVRFTKFASPKRSVTTVAEAVLVSLRQTNNISSLGAKIRVESSPDSSFIRFGLRQATNQEQTVFAQAMSEMLSPIENPKYLFIKKKKDKYSFWHSYACPSILASNKEDAEVLRDNLSALAGNFDLVYTYNAEGRKTLWQCCCRSYVNANTQIFKKLISWPTD